MKMKTVIVKTGSDKDFFSRGKALASLADKQLRLPEEVTISFDEPSELLQLLSAGRLDLFRTVKECPGSITSIAQKLNRDRSAVKRDVDQLANAGLVTLETKIHAGHGQMKEVRVMAARVRLEATLV